jgi:serine protease AprX
MQGEWASRVALAISWNDSKKEKKGKLLALFVASAISLMVMTPAMRASMSEGVQRMASVIVRALPGGETDAATAVESVNGEVGRSLAIINGFEATVPQSAIAGLEANDSIYEVTPNGKVQFLQYGGAVEPVTGNVGSLATTTKVTGAKNYWAAGYTGQGVDVALIDTGVSPVPGLSASSVINGPDLSFESQYPEVQYLDTMGHGTHMAGIIAGDDVEGTTTAPGEFQGMAPDARILNVKVGATDGAADVSQVIAAIDFVVQHKNDNGMNVRVLNLSFGTDGTQEYLVDPLTYAAEVAWRKGIVVVVAAGNSGFGSPKLNNPAYDPYVIAVSTDDHKGTTSVSDDIVPEWTSRGDATRHPDLVAPGISQESLRVPGSYLDEEHPTARLGNRYFKGTGTSQSAAVVSGAAALILSRYPNLNPDQVKAILVRDAKKLPQADNAAQGAGMLQLQVNGETVPSVLASKQIYPFATGLGSLDLARGTMYVQDLDGDALRGEQDIFGTPWDGMSWSGKSWSGTSWSGGDWNGKSWSGMSWSGMSWSGKSWSGKSWSGTSWSGKSWSGMSWSGKSWSGTSWSGTSWSGKSWSGMSWSGKSWSGMSWSGMSWSGMSWSGMSWS